MLSPFGKLVRKARIDAGAILKDLSDYLNVSPAFLSRVEMGKSKVPENWLSLIPAFFDSRGVAIADLAIAIDLSNGYIPLNRLSPEQQQALATLAHLQESTLNPDQIAELVKRFIEFIP